MPPITPAALRQQLASGETAPLFLLVGADDVEKAAMAAEFADAVDEGLRVFNVDRFYGGDIKVETLLDAAATLPMMVPRRVVIVFEAERLLVPKREGKAADADQEALERFIEAPAPRRHQLLEPRWAELLQANDEDPAALPTLAAAAHTETDRCILALRFARSTEAARLAKVQEAKLEGGQRNLFQYGAAPPPELKGDEPKVTPGPVARTISSGVSRRRTPLYSSPSFVTATQGS